jgi:hypothetical protein
MPGRQVALFIIRAITEGTQTPISSRIPEMLALIFALADTSDEFVVSGACRTLEEMIEFLSSPLSSFLDTVTHFLLSNLSCPDSLKTLDSLFFRFDSSPQNLPDIINGFFVMFAAYQSRADRADSRMRFVCTVAC